MKSTVVFVAVTLALIVALCWVSRHVTGEVCEELDALARHAQLQAENGDFVGAQASIERMQERWSRDKWALKLLTLHATLEDVQQYLDSALVWAQQKSTNEVVQGMVWLQNALEIIREREMLLLENVF